MLPAAVCVHFFQSIRLIFDNFPRFPPISLKLLSLNIFFQIVSLFEAGPLLPTWLGEGIELAGDNTEKGSREAIFIRWLHVTSECLQMMSMICYSSSCLFHCSTKLRVRKLKCSGQSSDLKADSNTLTLQRFSAVMLWIWELCECFCWAFLNDLVLGTQRGADNPQSDPSN